MIFLESVTPMQNSLRDVEQINEMIDFVKKGGIFSLDVIKSFAEIKCKKEKTLIKIVKFEDSSCFLHNGHHRATAIWMAGRVFLHPEEYCLEEWRYEDYLEINLDKKWYTPFDPRKEVRINHILPYKGLVEEFLETKPGEEEIRRFIFSHYESNSYTEPRSAKTIAEVAKSLLL